VSAAIAGFPVVAGFSVVGGVSVVAAEGVVSPTVGPSVSGAGVVVVTVAVVVESSSSDDVVDIGSSDVSGVAASVGVRAVSSDGVTSVEPLVVITSPSAVELAEVVVVTLSSG